jgi:hypothetical protein
LRAKSKKSRLVHRLNTLGAIVVEVVVLSEERRGVSQASSSLALDSTSSSWRSRSFESSRLATPGSRPSSLAEAWRRLRFAAVEVVILVVAFVAAHRMTLLLRPFRSDIAAFLAHVSPWLTAQFNHDAGELRPLGDVAWVLLVVAPSILLPLRGLDRYLGSFPSRRLSVLSLPLAVASGLAFVSLVILTFHLREWSRLFLATFGFLAAAGLGTVRHFFLSASWLPALTSEPSAAVIPAPDRHTTAAPDTRPAGASLPEKSGAADDGVALSLPSPLTRYIRESPRAHHSPVTGHDRWIHDILERIATHGVDISQRRLADELEIALGLTNQLLKKIAAAGWITIDRVQHNHVRYLITAEGLVEKERLSRKRLTHNLRFYGETRGRIQRTLDALAAAAGSVSSEGATSHTRGHDADTDARLRIVVYGTGEMAEIGFALLSETPLSVVAVVGESGKPRFCGRPVHRLEDIEGCSIAGERFDHVLVMTLDDVERVKERLVARGVPIGAIGCIS